MATVTNNRSTHTTTLESSSELRPAEWIRRLFGEHVPLGFHAGDANLYRYARNNAPNLTDPSGLAPMPMPAQLPSNLGSLGLTVPIPGGAGFTNPAGTLRITWDGRNPGPHGTPHWDLQGLPGARGGTHVRLTPGGRALTQADLQVLSGNGITTQLRRGASSGGGGGPRRGSIDRTTLAALGATAITVGGVTYVYDRFVGEFEQLGAQLATQVGLGRRLQLLQAAGMLPAGTFFNIEREGQPTIHVMMVQRNGQWWFTASHAEERWSWDTLRVQRVYVEDIRVGTVPAHHPPRPHDGPVWEEGPRRMGVAVGE